MGRPWCGLWGGLRTGGLGRLGQPCDGLETCTMPPSASRPARNVWNARQRGQLTKGAAGRRAARRRTSRRSTSSNDLSSSGCLEEAGQQPDRRDRRDALREQVARYTLGHLPTREAAPSTQCEAGVRDWAKASSGSRQPEFTRRPPHRRCGMSSSPMKMALTTQGIPSSGTTHRGSGRGRPSA